MPIDLRTPPGVRPLTNDEADRLDSQHPRPKTCVTCEGEGSFLWWDQPESPTRQVHRYQCECGDQRVLYRHFLHCGIGAHFQRLCWGDMRWAEEGAMEFVAEYMEHSRAYMRAGQGMMLEGSTGAGKTALATLVLKFLISEGHDGFLTTFNEMIDTFTSGWRDPEEQRHFHRRIKNAEVLVLDDPGKEITGRISVPAMDEVLRHRVAGAKPTIITSNLSAEGFSIRYGEYVANLLIEQAVSYRFTGVSRRHDRLARDFEERKLGLVRPVVVG